MLDLSSVDPSKIDFGGNKPPAIYHMTQPKLPAWRFEYHPDAQRVYAIKIGTVPERGENIANNVLNHGMAQNFVLAWMRGYLHRDNPEEHTRSE